VNVEAAPDDQETITDAADDQGTLTAAVADQERSQPRLTCRPQTVVGTRAFWMALNFEREISRSEAPVVNSEGVPIF
jgi:hypothetical protein